MRLSIPHQLTRKWHVLGMLLAVLLAVVLTYGAIIAGAAHNPVFCLAAPNDVIDPRFDLPLPPFIQDRDFLRSLPGVCPNQPSSGGA